jgi:hypothetical protein
MKTLRVAAPVLSAIVEAGEMDFRRNLEICMP